MSTAVLLRSAQLHMREVRSSPSIAVIGLVQPAAVQTVLLASGDRGDAAHATALVTGTTLLSLWSTTIWSAGMLLSREIRFGTLTSLLARPTDLRLIIAGKALGAGTTALALSTAVSAAVPTALGYHLRVADPLLLLATALLALASAAAVGTLLAGLFITSRSAGRIAEALLFPVFLLSGALVPLNILPSWLQWPSTLLDLRWLHDLSMAAAQGLTPSPAAALTLLVCISAQYAAGHVIFERLLDRARTEDTLDRRTFPPLPSPVPPHRGLLPASANASGPTCSPPACPAPPTSPPPAPGP
ncbi:ABC transporter permease [Kitasatospora sp. NPDC085879]|uniref:ABC transporter permease n=1 Tax=Kitasatospora sp. NPDC085879 TaxID=3154769 RepID=UPI003416C560